MVYKHLKGKEVDENLVRAIYKIKPSFDSVCWYLRCEGYRITRKEVRTIVRGPLEPVKHKKLVWFLPKKETL